jgi:hypothetical protein
MVTWRVLNGRHKVSETINAAAAGPPQFVRMCNEKANLKTFLSNEGYSGAGEDQFDAILADVRGRAPDFPKSRETED